MKVFNLYLFDCGKVIKEFFRRTFDRIKTGRVVSISKYKKGYGSIAIKEHFIPATAEELQEVHQKLQDNKGVVGERSKVIAELDNIYYGRVLIKPKNPIVNTIDNFVNLDPEIWSQMGQLLQEHVKSQEIKLGAKGFGIGIDVGEWGDVGETTGPWLKLSMRPRLEHNRGHQWGGRAGRPLDKDGKPMGSMEVERIAEKLRDPETYAKEWGAKDTPSIRGYKIKTHSNDTEREVLGFKGIFFSYVFFINYCNNN